MKKTRFTKEDLEVSPFDVAEYLTTEGRIAAYLKVSLEDPDPDIFLAALNDVARARGMAQLAKDTGLARESLYRTFQPGKDPHFSTVKKIMGAFGVTLTTRQQAKPKPARSRNVKSRKPKDALAHK